VLSLDQTGGYYRAHGSNNHQKQWLDLPATRQLIVRTHQTHSYVQEFAHRLGLVDHAGKGIAKRSVTFLANRLISLRLEPSQHPINDDTRFALARRGILASWQRTDMPRVLQLIYSAWFFLAAIAPKGATRWLAQQFFYPETRGQWFNIFLSNLRKAGPVDKLQL
jgi:hypothetical protein